MGVIVVVVVRCAVVAVAFNFASDIVFLVWQWGLRGHPGGGWLSLLSWLSAALLSLWHLIMTLRMFYVGIPEQKCLLYPPVLMLHR